MIGALLVAGPCVGRIVEVEAYEQDSDLASHSRNGQTSRNQSMFGPAGTLYVYRIYGIHWCANVVCGPRGHGAAVLIRAVEPLEGLDLMAARRGRPNARPTELCSGPGKLCQAFGLSGEHDGIALRAADSPVRLTDGKCQPEGLSVGRRIGITKSMDLPWRFGESGSPFLSRPF